MNVETKEVWLGYDENREKSLKEYEMFGWEYSQDVRRGRTNYQLLLRDKNIPHYYEVVELDDRYFELKKKKKVYTPIYDDWTNFLLMFILLILFVVPLVLYLLFKHSQKVRVKNYNNKLQTEMNDLANKAKQLMQDKK